MTSFPGTCRIGLSLAAVCASLLAGCGDSSSKAPTGDVRITVTFDGAPVTAGRVDLATDRPGQGGGADLDSSGVATITGVPTGDYTVVVIPPLAIQAPGEAPPQVNSESIPKRVRAMATSPFKATIKAGKADLKIELKNAK